MTPQLAESLQIHEPNDAAARAGEGVLAPPLLVALPSPVRGGRPDLDDACLPALWRREALHRRMLGAFDVAAASLVLLLVLGMTAPAHAAGAGVTGVLLLLVLFKVAGLYDRDELRLVHSTLDELPVLVQLTGL